MVMIGPARRCKAAARALALLCLSTALHAADTAPEKFVTVYATYGVPGADNWTIPLRIWVHEKPDFARLLLARAARDELAKRARIAELAEADKDRFMQRAEGFIADSESRESILFRFDGDAANRTFRLQNAQGESQTDRNGHLEGFLTLPNATAAALLAGKDGGWLTLRVVSADHQGTGRVRLIPAEGLSIVSDIDDTVKVTNIPSGEAEVLRNTFFRAFAAAPCMATLYAGFGEDVAFHYVSGGPWQLYEPLQAFLRAAEPGFPEGSFHMKNARTNPFESDSYRDAWKLISAGSEQATVEQKLGQIGILFEQFPRRRFILIGDSGERDPEVFTAVRDRYPDQVVEIRIRDVVNHAQARPERLRGMRIIPPNFGAQFDCANLQAGL